MPFGFIEWIYLYVVCFTCRNVWPDSGFWCECLWKRWPCRRFSKSLSFSTDSAGRNSDRSTGFWANRQTSEQVAASLHCWRKLLFQLRIALGRHLLRRFCWRKTLPCCKASIRPVSTSDCSDWPSWSTPDPGPIFAGRKLCAPWNLRRTSMSTAQNNRQCKLSYSLINYFKNFRASLNWARSKLLKWDLSSFISLFFFSKRKTKTSHLFVMIRSRQLVIGISVAKLAGCV